MIVVDGSRIDDGGAFHGLELSVQATRASSGRPVWVQNGCRRMAALSPCRYGLAPRRDSATERAGGGSDHPRRQLYASDLRRRLRIKLSLCPDNSRCIRSRILCGDQASSSDAHSSNSSVGFPIGLSSKMWAFCERRIAVTMPILPSPSVVTDAKNF